MKSLIKLSCIIPHHTNLDITRQKMLKKKKRKQKEVKG